METKTIIKNDLDYNITEDGRVFYPEREVEFFSPKRGCIVNYKKKARESNYNVTNSGYVKAGRFLVHRLVAEAYVEKPEGWEDNTNWTVNHKDGDKKNNYYTNLEWVPHIKNIEHWLNSDLAIEQGKIHPIEVHTVDGEWVGVFRAKTEAANQLGLHKPTITNCIKGKFKQSGGYTFREISKEEYYALRKTNN